MGCTRVKRRNRSNFLLSAAWEASFLLSATPYDHTALLRRALIGLFFYATSCHSTRSSQATSPGVPPGNPPAAAAGLPRRGVSAGKSLAKDFCFPFCSKFTLTLVRSRGQKCLQSFGACYFRARIFCQNAGAKSEYAHFRANMSEATA